MSVIEPRRDRRWVTLWIVVILAVSCAPYLIAWAAAPEGKVFGGILYNPLDGHSYLAKMRQGWGGGWLFRLPFTEEPQQGAFVFTLYLLLGHAARTLSLSLPLTFHLARILASAFMLAALWRLVRWIFADSTERNRAFLLSALGAGLGWLFPMAEPLFPDLWIPEAYMFYSALSNPHFPLALGLMAVLADAALAGSGAVRRQGEAFGSEAAKPYQPLVGMSRPYLLAGACGLALAVVQPFAVPLIVAALAAFATLRAVRRQAWKRALGVAAAAGAASLPVLAYDWWVYGHDPALAAWATQNVTASPPAWHWLAGFGLLAALAFAGLWVAARRSPSPLDLPAVWMLVAAVGMYIPFALQRRFSAGLLLPVGMLATVGFAALTARMRPRLRGLVFALTLGIASLSSLMLLALGVAGGLSGEARLFLSRDEADALAELRVWNGGQGVALASPELSAFVPAWAGNPVVYGHPYETIRAEEKRAGAERFFAVADETSREQFLKDHRVAFLIWGPREAAISAGLSPESLGLRLLFRKGSVEVWAAGDGS